jgi:CRP-like cAMP-binding protein
MSQSLPDMILREDSANPGKAGRGRAPEQRIRRTKRETATALAGVHLFEGFRKKDLNRLAAETDELDFAPGQKIVEEGQLGETLFVVMAGQAKITRNKRKVGEVVPGDFFGELSAIDGGPRTATVTAETPMRVLRLFRRTLIKLLEDEPALAVRMLDGMAARLRQIDRLNAD